MTCLRSPILLAAFMLISVRAEAVPGIAGTWRIVLDSDMVGDKIAPGVHFSTFDQEVVVLEKLVLDEAGGVTGSRWLQRPVLHAHELVHESVSGTYVLDPDGGGRMTLTPDATLEWPAVRWSGQRVPAETRVFQVDSLRETMTVAAAWEFVGDPAHMDADGWHSRQMSFALGLRGSGARERAPEPTPGGSPWFVGRWLVDLHASVDYGRAEGVRTDWTTPSTLDGCGSLRLEPGGAAEMRRQIFVTELWRTPRAFQHVLQGTWTMAQDGCVQVEASVASQQQGDFLADRVTAGTHGGTLSVRSDGTETWLVCPDGFAGGALVGHVDMTVTDRSPHALVPDPVVAEHVLPLRGVLRKDIVIPQASIARPRTSFGATWR